MSDIIKILYINYLVPEDYLVRRDKFVKCVPNIMNSAGPLNAAVNFVNRYTNG